MNYKLLFTKQAVKDYELVKKSVYNKRVKNLLFILRESPYDPPLEKLVGEYSNAYSRRINQQHRLVYEIYEENKTVKILRMWTHYGE